MKPTLSVQPGLAIGRRAISALTLVTLLGCSSAEEAAPMVPGPTAGAAGSPVAGGGSAGSASTAGAGGSAQAGAGGSAQAGAGGSAQAGAGGSAQAGAGGSAQAGAGGSGGALSPGETLYVVNCAACHGPKGEGAMFAPEIQHPVRDYANWVVRNGRAQTTYPMPMEKFPADKLSDGDLALIWEYLDKPPQPLTGQALYRDYCANCHGADAKGGPTMRPILEKLTDLKKRVREGVHLGEFSMRREYMPALGVSRISDAELQLIYDYVASL